VRAIKISDSSMQRGELTSVVDLDGRQRRGGRGSWV
jgi:hypothetical protein